MNIELNILDNYYCCVCDTKIRKPNKEMEYLGFVCSTCFRMSKKTYIEYVDIMSKIKIQNILNEIKIIKRLYP